MSHVGAHFKGLDGLGDGLPSHPASPVVLPRGWERCPTTPRSITELNEQPNDHTWSFQPITFHLDLILVLNDTLIIDTDMIE